jgi:hypothetical protein
MSFNLQIPGASQDSTSSNSNLKIAERNQINPDLDMECDLYFCSCAFAQFGILIILLWA